MSRPKHDRPRSWESPEWLAYCRLKERYDAVKAISELSSQLGRLPESPLRDQLHADVRALLQSRQVEPKPEQLDVLAAQDSHGVNPSWKRFLPRRGCPDCGSLSHDRCNDSDEV